MKWIWLIMLMFLGCAPKVEYQTVYKTKFIYLKPSDTILKYEIDTPTPPDKLTYIKASPIQREELLTNYIIDLLKTINKYKEKENAIINWYDNNKTR